ncbi:MAG TPA: hypothetical protein VMU54_04235 [Planctomycetota bacterium]|nr:hypothetical protein [Planctomycetota bacterium]
MEHYCINHSNERAVGLCGTCKRPACYQCSLTIDQVIYCSAECFNELDPPSSPSEKLAHPRLAEDFSDVVWTTGAPGKDSPSAPHAPANSPLGSDPSVILTPQPDDAADAAYVGKSPVSRRGTDESTLMLSTGARRTLLSSSCFFHPDASAIVLCANCRNPICALCAKEVPEGLVCSPSCGPVDRAAERERRRLTTLNAALIVAAVLVLLESMVLVRGIQQEWALAAARAESGSEDRDLDPSTLDPELRQAAALMAEAESLLLEAAEAAHPGGKTSAGPQSVSAKMGRVAGKLRQARDLYQARLNDAPDPAAVQSRIETISNLLDGLRSTDDPELERAGKSPATPR